jgi:glycogen debranching enzyme
MTNGSSIRGPAQELVQIGDRYYVLSTSSRLDPRTRAVKSDDTFGVFDRLGDLAPAGMGELGLFHEDTRHLSRLSFTIDGERPLLLASEASTAGPAFTAFLTNPDLLADPSRRIPRGALWIERRTEIAPGVCRQEIWIRNQAACDVRLRLALALEADFADVFEVRGSARARRGELRDPELQPSGVLFSYRGLDGVLRRTRLSVSRAVRFDEETAEIDLAIDAGARDSLTITAWCGSDRPRSSGRRRPRPAAPVEPLSLETSSRHLAAWHRRSIADLRMMMTETPSGPFPYAGIPWFSAPFGRDGLMTALQLLWLDPATARGVLAFLADTQADSLDGSRDAEPGKILHEARHGEMAALGEVPFGRYYGSVDATPLFVWTAGEYLARTGDVEFLDSIAPSLARALDWMSRSADAEGFLRYAGSERGGLRHQGWKDSLDAVFHADGRDAPHPIAMCEVQAYAWAAWSAAAAIARALGEEDPRPAEFEARAESLRSRFEALFWSEKLRTYGLARDGEGRLCHVRTSNPGHALWAGIALPDRAAIVAETLMSGTSFSGWGIRTVAEGEARFNPLAYHNGSIWPHDTSVAAAGMARYGRTDLAARLLGAALDLSRSVDLHRLPELFCGASRDVAEGPLHYPLACAPQAWAAGALYLLLQASLGLEVRARPPMIRFRRARLPAGIESLRIRNLEVAGSTVLLELTRRADGSVRVESRGNVPVRVEA